MFRNACPHFAKLFVQHAPLVSGWAFNTERILIKTLELYRLYCFIFYSNAQAVRPLKDAYT